MAGDWIKMRTSLLTNPKVNGIAKALECDASVCNALSTGFSGVMSGIVKRNVMRHVTVSSLLVVWGSANEHTKDGVFVNSDLADLDDMTGIPTFGEAMASVGWAVYDEVSNSVTLPNFNEYNTSGSVRSAGAKSNAQRQKEYRDRQKSQQSDVTSDVTALHESNRREEKRREEKKVNTERESATHSTPSQPVSAKQKTEAIAKPQDVEQQTWADWCQLRKAKKATVSSTVIDGAREEAGKAGMSLEAFLKVWCLRGSQGLEASWLKPEERKQSAKQPLNKQQALEQRNRDVAEQFLKSRGFQNAPV